MMPTAPRLVTRLVVQALMRRLAVADHPVAVLHRGDPDAGDLLVAINRFAAGTLLFGRGRDGAGNLVWQSEAGGALLDAPGLANHLARALKRDPDLWIVALEDPRGRLTVADLGPAG